MRLYLYRHGSTKGNLERRYVGSTDEELLDKSADEIRRLEAPAAGRIYVSPMRRCIQTAQLLYPGKPLIVIEEFRECDFGAYEYCNYDQLKGQAAYQRFIDTFGKCGFPGGEDRDAFQDRCLRGFAHLLEQERACAPLAGKDREAIAMVVHGGTIMALLDRYSDPHGDYYDWQIGCGQGFSLDVYEETPRTVNGRAETKAGQFRFRKIERLFGSQCSGE